MKEIIITPEELQDLESIQGIPIQGVTDPEALRVLKFMKTRNVTTRKLLEVKLGIPYRTTRTLTDKLIKAHLIEKGYAYIRAENNARIKTAVFTVIKNEKRKRNNKRV